MGIADLQMREHFRQLALQLLVQPQVIEALRNRAGAQRLGGVSRPDDALPVHGFQHDADADHVVMAEMKRLNGYDAGSAADLIRRFQIYINRMRLLRGPGRQIDELIFEQPHKFRPLIDGMEDQAWPRALLRGCGESRLAFALRLAPGRELLVADAKVVEKSATGHFRPEDRRSIRIKRDGLAIDGKDVGEGMKRSPEFAQRLSEAR